MSSPSSLPRGAARPWVWSAALAFVLLTLAALVLVPFLVQRRVTSLRTEMEASEPARTLAGRLHTHVTVEMASLTEFLLSGDPEYSRIFSEARADEREAYDSLSILAARLGPEVRSRFQALRELTRAWHARMPEEEILAGRAEGVRRSLQSAEDRRLYVDLVRAFADFDAAVLEETARVRARIAATERAGLRLTFVLGLLALLSAALVAALTLRVRRYAAESERRRRDAEEALAELARANETRGRLLRGITHDVKNPLGAAKGYAQLLAMGIKAPLAPEQAPLVAGVQRSVDSALAIITDLLDVARADSGGLPVHRVEADLAAVAREAVEIHRAAAEAAGHVLELERHPEPLTVYTDPARVAQVLGNLVSNAVKYTPPPGRITVRLEVVGDDDASRAGAWATVRVVDTGPGIPPGQREAIFEEFTRLEDDGGQKGHGLGLAIARRIARLLGGDLSVTDSPGSGATFVLWLPLRSEALPSDGPGPQGTLWGGSS